MTCRKRANGQERPRIGTTSERLRKMQPLNQSAVLRGRCSQNRKDDEMNQNQQAQQQTKAPQSAQQPQQQPTSTEQPPKTFTTIDGKTLMSQQFEPLQFSVDRILPHGLFILAGSPKVGKSWLALDICQAVATGGSLWEFTAQQGTALYLALEDNHNRLQGRLSKFGAGAVGVDVNADVGTGVGADAETNATDTTTHDISALHMTTTSFGIHDGLLEQAHNFLAAHPETNIIVIDTLEHIRNGGMDKTLYSYDYQDMCKLREITNKHKLTLLLVHHTRKMHDSDPLNTISGSTGLIGAVDGVFVLEKNKRTENAARLTIANRDTEGFCFKLKFDTDTCRWSFMGHDTGDGDGGSDDDFAIMIDDFLADADVWSGTSTELCTELKKMYDGLELNPSTLGKRLRASLDFFKIEMGIVVDFDRSSQKKKIHLSRLAVEPSPPKEENQFEQISLDPMEPPHLPE